MRLKSEKGVVGTDIVISVIVLFIFVSLISMLIYNFNTSAKEATRKTTATELAIKEIEKIKSQDFDTLETYKTTGKTIETGYDEVVTVKDYADIDTTKQRGFVKKITVTIKYNVKGKTEQVELSTICTKEN